MENTKGCKSCRNKNYNFTITQVGVLLTSLYITLSSIYGTYILLKNLFN